MHLADQLLRELIGWGLRAGAEKFLATLMLRLLPPRVAPSVNLVWRGGGRGGTEADMFLSHVDSLLGDFRVRTSWQRAHHVGCAHHLPGQGFPQVRFASWVSPFSQLSWALPLMSFHRAFSFSNSTPSPLASASLMPPRKHLPPQPTTPWMRVAHGGIDCPAFSMTPRHWLRVWGAADPRRPGGAVNLPGGDCQLMAPGWACRQGLHSDRICSKHYGLVICAGVHIGCGALWMWRGERRALGKDIPRHLLGNINILRN